MIPETRKLVAEHLADGPWSVHRWFPDDVSGVPCVVVGRPEVTVNRGMWSMTLPVIAIGRRLADDDAQHELDVVGDLLATTLMTVPGLAGTLRDVTATVTDVAGMLHPSYTATLAVTGRPC
jgi:hypothetical protein